MNEFVEYNDYVQKKFDLMTESELNAFSKVFQTNPKSTTKMLMANQVLWMLNFHNEKLVRKEN